jgi:hypothetical protein
MKRAAVALAILAGCGGRTPLGERGFDEDAAIEASASDDAGFALRCFGAERTCRCARTLEPGPRGSCGPATFGQAAHCCRTQNSGACRCQVDALPCVREAQACRCGGPFPVQGVDVTTCTPPSKGGCCRTPQFGVCSCSLSTSCSAGTTVSSCQASDAVLACTADEVPVNDCD